MKNLKDFRLLVVDDDHDYNLVLCTILRTQCDSVLSAMNGKEALALFASHPIDCIISDVQMPVMDGISLVKELRRKHSTVPAILLASGQSKLDLQSAIELGANGLIQKPFPIDEVFNFLNTLRTRQAA